VVETGKRKDQAVSATDTIDWAERTGLPPGVCVWKGCRRPAIAAGVYLVMPDGVTCVFDYCVAHEDMVRWLLDSELGCGHPDFPDSEFMFVRWEGRH
jgi:hypothetical protein